MTMTQQVESHQAVVNHLKGRIRGPLLRPGDPGFDEARSVWNAMIDRRPALIVRCLGVSDVIACVNAAREYGMQLSVKGGGHNIAGLAVCEGGLMLDMSLMRGVWVDPAERVARAQAGCLLGDVDAETQIHGLAAMLGFVSNTGCAGLTLGGGFGYLTRRFGWTTRQSRIGRSRHGRRSGAPRIRAGEHRPLLGAARRRRQLRRRHQLRVPASPGRAGRRRRRDCLAWPKRPPAFSRCIDRWQRRPRGSLTCVAGLRLAPPAPWIAKDVHGKPIVALFVCYSGPLGGSRAVAGADQGLSNADRRHCSATTLYFATEPARCYPAKGSPLLLEVGVSSHRLEPGSSQRAIDSTRPGSSSPHSADSCSSPSTARSTELPEAHSAVGNRDAAAVLNIASRVGATPRTTTRNIEWARCGLARPAPASPPAGPTSTSSPRRKATSASRRVPHELRTASSRSRRSGIRRTSFARTRTSVLQGKAADRPGQTIRNLHKAGLAHEGGDCRSEPLDQNLPPRSRQQICKFCLLNPSR